MFNKLTSLLTIALLTHTLIYSQGVSINQTGNAADASAMLDISSTNSGVLIPRMDSASIAAIVSPATSLLVYQTDADSGFYYYNGSVWMPFLVAGTAANNGWTTTGNSNTVAGTNFIGTIDNVDWVIKTNNIEQMRVSSTGNVGIGQNGVVSRRLYLDGDSITQGLGGAFWIDSDNREHGSSVGQILLNANGSSTDQSRIIFRNSTQGVYGSIKGIPSGLDDGGFTITTRESGSFNDALSIINNGNVGIGTMSPSQRLDVANVGLPTTSTSRLANIESYNAGDALLWGHTNTLASASLGAKSGNGAAYLQFFAYHSNNSNNSRYTGNPYGGGDIAYPARILSDDGTENNVLTFESGDSPGQDSEITWTKRMVINQNGNVGVGTTSPSHKLHIAGSTPSGGNDLVLGLNNTTATIDATTFTHIRFDESGTTAFDIGYLHSSQKLIFENRGTVNTGADGASHMAIDANGNVAIGHISPNQKLDVVGTIQASNLTGGATTLSTDANGNIIRTPSDKN